MNLIKNLYALLRLLASNQIIIEFKPQQEEEKVSTLHIVTNLDINIVSELLCLDYKYGWFGSKNKLTKAQIEQIIEDNKTQAEIATRVKAKSNFNRKAKKCNNC